MTPAVVAALILQYRYAILAPAAFFFGPIVSLVAGFLLRLGSLELVGTVAALAGGELFGDVLWYGLGYRYGDGFVKRFGKYVGITDIAVMHAKQFFHRYHDWIIIISKLTAGFGFAPAIFFTAGLSGVPFRRYMLLNIIGQVIWTSSLLTAGYYLGGLFINAGNPLQKFSTIAGGFVLVLIIFGIGRALKHRVEEEKI